MATEAPFEVTGVIKDLTTGLVDGSQYRCQNLGPALVRYVNAASATDAATRAWRECHPGHFFRFGVTEDDAVYVQASGSGKATLSIAGIYEASENDGTVGA